MDQFWLNLHFSPTTTVIKMKNKMIEIRIIYLILQFLWQSETNVQTSSQIQYSSPLFIGTSYSCSQTTFHMTTSMSINIKIKTYMLVNILNKSYWKKRWSKIFAQNHETSDQSWIEVTWKNKFFVLLYLWTIRSLSWTKSINNSKQTFCLKRLSQIALHNHCALKYRNKQLQSALQG